MGTSVPPLKRPLPRATIVIPARRDALDTVPDDYSEMTTAARSWGT